MVVQMTKLRVWQRMTFAPSGLIALSLLLLFGCGSHTQLETSNAVRLWAVLRTACSSEDLLKLNDAEHAIEKALAAGEITPREHRLFAKVIELGKEGSWSKSLAACQRIHRLNL